MPSNSRWKHRFEEFKASLKELKKGLKLPRYNVVDRAGVIRLFEASLDLAMKTIRGRLVFEGHEVKSPKTAIRKAAEIGLIADLDLWLEMWGARNELRQVADREKAKKSLRLIKGKFSQLLFLLSKAINKAKSKNIIHDKHIDGGVEEIKWTEKTLGVLIQDDNAALQTGPFGTMLKAEEYTLDGVPVIAVQDIGDNRLRHEKIVKVSHETATRLARYRVQENDIIFSRKGSVERRAIVTKEEDGWLQGSDCIRLRINKSVDPRFISYQLGSQFHKNMLRQYAHGATMPSLNQGILELLPFRLPPYPSQTRIADILTSLDDKIELNRKMNETLEEMPQALFKRWFVDFEFPNEHGKPYKSAGGKMVDSPMGKIPKGWSVGSLLEHATLLSGGTPNTSEPQYWGGDIPWASAKDVSQCRDCFLIETERSITPLGLEKSATKIIPAYCSVVVSRGATTGRMVMFGKDIAMNQTCYALQSKNKTPMFLFVMLKSVMDKLTHAAHGSIFDTITTDTFKASRVCLPDLKIADDFESVIKNHFKQILSLQKENRYLSALRDTLLPKLLSGELIV